MDNAQPRWSTKKPRWSTKKKDHAPRGIFRHAGGGWGIRYTCGAGHVHEEKIGPIKGDALRAHSTRRARFYADPGWCPARERHQARALAQAEAAQEAKRVTFRQYAEGVYLPWAQIKRRRSYKTIRTEVTWLLSVLGDHWLAAITQDQLEQVLDDLQRGQSPSGRALSGAAVNRYRARLSGVFKRAMKAGLVERNPMAGTEKEEEPGGRIVYLPSESKIRSAFEERALRETLVADLHSLFAVSVHTGLRWSEQRGLQWRDVDLLAGFITVRHAKNGRSRQVPMNSMVQSVLLDLATQRQRPGDPRESVFRCLYREPDKFFPAAVERARKALEVSGKDTSHLDGYTWHGNRHTFASRLVMAGVDLRTVQQLGGWQSLAMVQRYSHLAPDHLRAAVERLVQSASDPAELGQDLDSAGSETEVDRRTVVQDTEKVTRRGGRARLKASDSKSDRGASPSGVQILSPPPNSHRELGRGGRVAEGAALEMPCTGNCTVGSNPTPSAISSGRREDLAGW